MSIMAPPSPSMSIDNTTAREDQEEMMREVEVQRRDSVRRQHLRNKVVEEILSSERAYLGHLNILMRVFVDGLSLVSKKVIAPAELRTLFGEIRSIRLINQVLCDHLSGGDVVGAFATLTPFLKLYSSYARNFPSSQHLLNDLMKRADFDQFVRAQEALPVCCGIKLPGFLIMPIQRIPRYKLLLQEFLKYTSTLQERSQVTEVLQQVDQVANLINDCVRDYDNSIKIVSVQKSLDAYAPKLLVPGRRLIKEGRLFKVTRRDSGRNQERMLWLFNDILVYAKRNPRKKDKFFCSCILPVRHCFVERPPGKTYFYLHCKGETTVLLAQTYGELDDWCIKLQSTIDEARVNRATLRKDSSCRLPLHRSFLSRLPRRRSSLGLRLKRKLEESAASSQAESDLAMSDSRQSGSGLLTAAAHRFFGLFRRKRSRADESAGFSQTEPYSKRSRLAVFQRPLSTVTEEDSDDGVFESPMNRMSVDMERDGPPIAINSSTPMRRKNTSSPPWWKKETNMKTTTTSKRHRFCSMM